MAILQTTITRENVHFQTSCCLAKLITRGGWTKNLVNSTLLGRCKLFLSGRETWNKSKKSSSKVIACCFFAIYLQSWGTSSISPILAYVKSFTPTWRVVCKYFVSVAPSLQVLSVQLRQIVTNQGVSMQPFCYWFLPSTNKLARIKVSLVTDGCQASRTVSNPGRVSIFLVWNPLKPDQRLVLMYSLEQRMTACCLVFSGEFFTCTGCWRQPGSWERSQSLNDCTVMRKRRS